MGSMIKNRGKLYSAHGRITFVSSPAGCPRINLSNSGKSVKFRDDYSKGLRVHKAIARLIFKN